MSQANPNQQMANIPAEKHGKEDKGKHDSDSDSDSDSEEEGVLAVLKKERHPNQFINIAYEDLVKWMGEYLSTKQPENWVRDWKAVFNNVLPRHNLLRTQARFKKLLHEYHSLDPSCTVTKPLQSAIPGKEHMAREVEIKVEKSPQGVLNPKAKRFMEGRIDSLLIECGFSKMPDDFLKAAKEEHGKNGLDVHVPSKEEVPCQMYYREQYEKPGVRRRWQSCFKEKPCTEYFFRNIALVYAYTYQKDDAPKGLCDKLEWMACNKAKRRAIGPPDSEGKVYVRCYNNIPINDLDMLMPGSSPNPTLFDVLFIVVPFLGGFGAAIYKIITLFHDLDNLNKVENLMIILFAIIAPFTVSFKAFVAAKNKLTLYRLHHAEMLIDHTVSCNSGTMMQLLSEAAAQENKEAVLAYTVLVLENRPMSAAAVRTRCNEMLQTMAPDSTSVDFDVADALSEITSAGLCTLCDNKDVQAKNLYDVRNSLDLDKFER